MPVAELLHHPIPEGALLVCPDSCSNCARQLYLEKGKQRICPNCSSAFEMQAQVWNCTECGTARKWGEMRPEQTGERYLGCARCCQVTEHEFSHVAR